MQLTKIRQLFLDSLINLYPKQEIYSLFEQTAENILHYKKIEIHQNLNKNIEDTAEKKILHVLHRLKLAEPIQYILGETYFYNCTISTDTRALIPRPETEYLVDHIVKTSKPQERLNIIDLGTGSGCIAIACALCFPYSNVYATDISKDALSLAKENARANNARVIFIHDDLLAPQKDYPGFDIIISNPPYVRILEKEFMHPNVLDYEPSLALFVEDNNPLLFYNAIAVFAEKHLKSNGIIYLEINENLSKETAGIFKSLGYRHVELIKDLNNKYRFLKIIR